MSIKMFSSEMKFELRCAPSALTCEHLLQVVAGRRVHQEVRTDRLRQLIRVYHLEGGMGNFTITLKLI